MMNAQPSNLQQNNPPTTQASTAAPAVVDVKIEEKTYLIIMHVSAAFVWFLGPLCFLVPLIMWLIKKNQSPTIDAHGKAATNFQISIAIYLVISFVLTFVIVGFFTLLAAAILSIICGIIGAIRASNGELFKYPLSIKFV